MKIKCLFFISLMMLVSISVSAQKATITESKNITLVAGNIVNPNGIILSANKTRLANECPILKIDDECAMPATVDIINENCTFIMAKWIDGAVHVYLGNAEAWGNISMQTCDQTILEQWKVSMDSDPTNSLSIEY